jgi:hypothetical protein
MQYEMGEHTFAHVALKMVALLALPLFYRFTHSKLWANRMAAQTDGS